MWRLRAGSEGKGSMGCYNISGQAEVEVEVLSSMWRNELVVDQPISQPLPSHSQLTFDPTNGSSVQPFYFID